MKVVVSRRVMPLAVVLGACAAPPPPDPPLQPDGWDSELAIPEAPDTDPAADRVVVDLVATVGAIEIRPGIPTKLWTYNGQLPGPVIRAKVGDHLVVRFKNELPEPTTIHWHGVRVPAAMDGSEAVQAPVQPGQSFEYSFDLLDAGTFWYHPHVRSSAQVGYGLYGALVVEDPRDPPLGDELVMMLSDINVDDAGLLAPGDENGWYGDYFGREGQVLLVNGRVLPTLKARPGLPQRWRLINAARARYFKLAVPGHEVIRIGGDGGLLSSPQPVEVVTLAPGERIELHVRPGSPTSEPQIVMWQDANRFHLPAAAAPLPLWKLQVTNDARIDDAARPPAALRDLRALDTTGAIERPFELMEKVDDADTGTVLAINGKTATEADPVHVHVGTTEIWTLTNTTRYDHPFHLHGFFFQVLDVDGKKPPVLEWKDTLNLVPRTKTRVAVTFDDRPGMWMFHCHILDHADMGMMGMLMVMPPTP